MRAPWLLSTLLAVVACASSTKTKQLADGSWKITCKSEYERCVHNAQKVCGDLKPRILSGGNKDQLYGTPGNQVAVTRSELLVICEDPDAPPPGLYKLPKREEPPPLVCAPGVTQRCVGAGACEGGQACLPDGSGFGPCDCGGSGPAAAPIVDAGAPEGGSPDAATVAPGADAAAPGADAASSL